MPRSADVRGERESAESLVHQFGVRELVDLTDLSVTDAEKDVVDVVVAPTAGQIREPVHHHSHPVLLHGDRVDLEPDTVGEALQQLTEQLTGLFPVPNTRDQTATHDL